LMIGFLTAALTTPAAPLVAPFLAKSVYQSVNDVWGFVEESNDADFKIGGYAELSLDADVELGMGLFKDNRKYDLAAILPNFGLHADFEFNPTIGFHKDGTISIEIQSSFSGEFDLNMKTIRTKGGACH